MRHHLFQCLLCSSSLLLFGCTISPNATHYQTALPQAQITPSPVAIPFSPDESSLAPGSLESTYTKDGAFSYLGYEVVKRTRKVKLYENHVVELSYAVLKKDGKIIAKFDSDSEQAINEVRFGLFPFLGRKTKQLIVEQTAPKDWRYWIVSLSPKFEVVYDSGKYGAVYDLRAVDINHDGIYELVQNLGTFWYFHALNNTNSPLPEIIFKYNASERKYIPANPDFQAIVLKDIEQRISKAREINLRKDDPFYKSNISSAVLDVLLHYIYAGKEREAWSFYNEEYDLPDKEALKSEIKEALKKDATYKATHNNGAT